MESLLEYSLVTPTKTNNILDLKIINMIKNENMVGGGIDNTNCIVILIGIIMIAIGFYLCWGKNDWSSTDGIVQDITCEPSQITTPCKFNLTYTVNSTQYSKVISMDKSAIPSNQIIPIYYQESNPNIVRLYNFNYSIIGIILIILGAFTLISSLCCINSFIPQMTNQSSESNLYTGSRNSDGINIVYTK